MILEITESNYLIYKNLVQAYEAEFSAITMKTPDCHGLFSLDTIIGDSIKAYVLIVKSSPIGFIAIELREHINEIKEFYIIPSCRKKSYGENLLLETLNLHHGNWEVKQLKEADNARAFWRKTIDKITDSNYKEEILIDDYWGDVTKQSFTY